MAPLEAGASGRGAPGGKERLEEVADGKQVGEVKDAVGKKTPFRWYAPSLPDWALPKEAAVVQPESNGRLGVYQERRLKA